MKKWIHIELRRGDMNWHAPDRTTLRRTWQIVRMGSYAKSWTLYVYRGDGRYHGLAITFPHWLGGWPKHLIDPRKDV